MCGMGSSRRHAAALACDRLDVFRTGSLVFEIGSSRQPVVKKLLEV